MNINLFIKWCVQHSISFSLQGDNSLKINAAPGSLTDEVKEQLKARKTEILEWLKKRQRDHIIPLSKDRNEFPLSFAQQRLWFIDRLQKGSAEYNNPMPLRVSGKFKLDIAEEALRQIIQRHDILRTIYRYDNELVQVVQDKFDFTINTHDLNDFSDADRESALASLVNEEMSRPFDLSNDLMLRAVFISLQNNNGGQVEGVLVFNIHHIACDGWSLELLMGEFVSLYQQLTELECVEFPPLTLRYADYVLWQQEWLNRDELDEQVQYWIRQLADAPLVHSIPLDNSRPKQMSHSASVVRGCLSEKWADKLQKVARDKQVTVFMLCHAILSLMLSRHSNGADILIGTPVANRKNKELESLIGFFANVLILRSNARQNTFSELLEHIKQLNLDAHDNQDVPFDFLIEKLNIPRSSAHSPLFQIMFSLNTEGAYGAKGGGSFNLPDVTMAIVRSETKLAKFDLDVYANVNEEGIQFYWIYNDSLFDHERIEKFNQHLETLFQVVLSKADAELSDLNMLSEIERYYLQHTLNATQADYPKDKCIHEFFELQVKQNPDYIALVFDDKVLTYKQLNEKANQLAHYLRAQYQVKPDTLVGLCVERSLEMVIGILGILKAGGAYVPLDPAYPLDRLNYMLEDTAAAVVLSQSHLKNVLDNFKGTALFLNELAEDKNHFCSEYIHTDVALKDSGLNSSHLAYVIYTSGSTGQPKGVMVEHKALVNRLCWMNKTYGLSSEDKVLHKTPYSFDVSVWEFLWTLGFGAQLVVARPEGHKDPDYLCELIQDRGISKLHFVPSMLGSMLDCESFGKCTSIRQVFCSGEALLSNHVMGFRQALPNTELHNLYGPTEAAIDVSSWDCRGDISRGVPIGKSIDNIQLLVLDEALGLAPKGAVGELFIGGDGLARGYLKSAALTKERFIDNPFYEEGKANSSPRLYRTGDLVSLRHNGDLDYHGRTDFQVKIRGFRIELKEIEHQLSQQVDVDSALVTAKEVAGSQQLVAYVKPVSSVSDQGHSEYIQSITSGLKVKLPDYMVPNIFIVLDEWPLTANGKIDRKGLPEPDSSASAVTYEAPQSEVENQLVLLWSKLLKIDAEALSVTANFFELGGHSLLAVRLMADIRVVLSQELPVRSIFESPTIRDLAMSIDSGSSLQLRQPVIPVTRKTNRLPLSFAQQRLWFIDQLEKGSAHYNMPMAMRVSGQFDIPAAELAMKRIIGRHETLRTLFSNDESGPVQIIRDEFHFRLGQSDLSHLTKEEQAKEIERWRIEHGCYIFDLSVDLMVRAHYLWLSIEDEKSEGVLLFNMHHIASDGWSMDVLMNEFVSQYKAALKGENDPLPTLKIQYADYSCWQRQWLEGETEEEQLSYWKEQLADMPVVHSLPLDYPRPKVKEQQGEVVNSSISVEDYHALQRIAHKHGITLFMLLHGALGLVLSRHSNSDDIVIGTPVANRLQSELEPLIGFFVNTLVLRTNSNYEKLSDYFKHIKDANLDAQANQDVPFEYLVERCCPHRSTQYTPLFQIMLNMNTSQITTLAIPELYFSAVETGKASVKFDLEINVQESEEGMHLNWIYDVSLFKESSIIRLHDHLKRLLTGIISSPESRVCELPMLAPEEIHYLIYELNKTAVDYPKDKLIHELFEEQASNHPDNIALVFEDKELTYKDLNERSNQLAHYLREQGVFADILVGLCVERGLDMVIGILSILKAGGGYVPLDPSYPEERLNYIMHDAQLKCLLIHADLVDTLSIPVGACVIIINDQKVTKALQDYSTKNLLLTDTQSFSNLAYVIYTSGSTGQPKGIMINHHSVTNLSNNLKTFGFYNDYGIFGWVSSIAFDASVQGLCMLLNGWGLHIISSHAKISKQVIHNLFAENTLNVIDCTPTLLELWFSMGLGELLPDLLIGGEVISGELWSELSNWQIQFNKKAYNVYGPTECCVNSSATLITKTEPNIGRALNNYQLYVLNDSSNLVPKGNVGELNISGAGLARGYLNQPDLTGEKFIPNPFSGEPGARLYKTGDLVRYLSDGNLEFIGRIDDQVKIRGFRIELGEIEHCLNTNDDVTSSLVLVRENKPRDKFLVAYVTVSDKDQQVNGDFIAALRSSLHNRLPGYMIPSDIIILDSFPLTPNGKIDKKALPLSDGTLHQGIYVAPKTDTEKALVEIWSKLLKLDGNKLSVTTNFFESGGHSLLAVRLMADIRVVLSQELPVRSIFESPTIRDLAMSIDSGSSLQLRQPVIPVTRKTNRLPLSFAQQRLWFIDQLEKGSAHYNMPMAMRVSGQFDIPAAELAMKRIIGRHETLRTLFSNDESGPVQIIRDEFHFRLGQSDLSRLTKEEQAKEIEQWRIEHGCYIFDLSVDLMVRAHYLWLSIEDEKSEGVLLFNMHHIASDGWSMGVLMNEFVSQYKAALKGENDPLPTLEIQYADYSYWQRQWLEGETEEEQLSYWKEQLADMPVVHSLPLDYPRPKVKEQQGEVVNSSISVEDYHALQRIAHKHGTTLFMLLHGALGLVLSRHSNSDDIVIGTPVANRLQSELEPLIGFFVNTLVLRTNSNYEKLSDYLKHIKEINLNAQANQDVPFEHLVEQCQVSRTTQHTPLFQIMLSMNTSQISPLTIPEVHFSAVETGKAFVKFDLEINVQESEEGMHLNWIYDVSLFKESSIIRLHEHLKRLLTGIISSPESRVCELPMLAPEEIHYLIYELNKTEKDYPKNKCIHELFEQQVKQNPDHIALVFDDKALTYKQLNEKANQLAYYLRDHHQIKPDTLVGLCVERSLEMVIGILGILKAGGAYVPLDPAYPQDRLNYMLEDTSASVVLSQFHLKSVLDNFKGAVLFLNELAENKNHFCSEYTHTDVALKESGLNSSHLAYVIYTSGSTGRPKGVMVEHKALLNRLCWMNKAYGLSSEDKILHKTPYSFDVSVWEFLWTLGFGAQLVVARPEGHKDPDYLCELIQYREISKLHFVPSMLGSMLECKSFVKCKSIRQVFCSGEALLSSHVIGFKQTLPNAELHNLYGPTEAAIDVSYWDCRGDISGGVSIGKPIDNIQLLILDKSLGLVPTGAIGELFIGGDGLARGYLKKIELTKERFIDNPFYEEGKANSSPRLYRTGDLVSLRHNGDLDYHGRTDFQVKIRGFRIELKEIEHQLSQQRDVDSALVTAKEVASSLQLVAYVKPVSPVSEQGHNEYIHSISSGLKAQLPGYMVPNILMVLDEWPLTSNGKINRKALPEPDSTILNGEYIAPQTQTEEMLVDVWGELLGLDADTISTTANFFELGGHSLLVVKLIGILQQKSQQAEAKQLYNCSTLSEMASYLDKQKGDAQFQVPENLIPADCDRITPDMLQLISLQQNDIDTIVEWIPGGVKDIQDIYPLGPLQRGILFHHRMDVESDPYLLEISLRFKDIRAVNSFIDAINFVVERHDVLRTVFIWQGLVEPVQVVLKTQKITVLDYGVGDTGDIETELREINQTIDVSKDPLAQLSILRNADEPEILGLLKLHHLAIDGESMQLLQNEVFSALNGLLDNLRSSVPYRNIIAYFIQKPFSNSIEYFNDKLSSITEPTLPYGLSTVNQQKSAFREQHILVSEVASNAIRNWCRKQHLSPATFFHAVWALVLARCCNQKEVVFGTVLSGRLQSGLGFDKAMGLLINTLPISVNLDNLTVAGLLEKFSEELIELTVHEQFPLVEALKCSKIPTGIPLFSSYLNYRHVTSGVKEQSDKLDSAQHGIEFLDYKERTNYPLRVSVDDFGDGFRLNILIDKQIDITQVAGQLQATVENLIQSLVNRPDQPCLSIEVLSENEIHHLLYELNEPNEGHRKDMTMHELFIEQVVKTPDNIAVIDKEGQLTYAQVFTGAMAIAEILKQHQIEPEQLVAIRIPKGRYQVIATMGIMMAGAAYLPLETHWPTERCLTICEKANSHLMLVAAVEDELEQMGLKILNVQEIIAVSSLSKQAMIKRAKAFTAVQAPEHLAYVIFTSGSTGEPKGVEIEHRAAINTVLEMNRYYQVTEQDKILAVSALSFDLSVYDIFGLLGVGGVVVFPEHDYATDPAHWLQLIEIHQVTLWDTVPASASLLAEQIELQNRTSTSPLRHIFMSGDWIAPNLPARLWKVFPGCKVHSLGGATEGSIWSIHYPIQQDMSDRKSVPYGKPMYGQSFYILNEAGQFVPKGIVGELHIGGHGVARGYCNDKIQTDARFVWNEQIGQRLYKTGDMGRYFDDGNIEFIGRVDFQVKIRGFRVELNEIESKLTQLQGIDKAVASIQGNDELKQLTAHVVIARDSEYLSYTDLELSRELRLFLRSSLPEYMIPAAIMQIPSLPLTANGKVDKQSLPKVDLTDLFGKYVAPETEIEKILTDIFAELLELDKDQVSTKTNFFELGGHSLIMVKLIGKLQQCGYQPKARELYLRPVLSDMAKYLEKLQPVTHFIAPDNLISENCQRITPDMLPLVSLNQSEIDAIVESSPGGIDNIQDIYSLGPLQQGMLYHHQIAPETDPYLLEVLMNIEDKDTIDRLEWAINQLIARHDILRTIFIWWDVKEPVQVVLKHQQLAIHYIEKQGSHSLYQELKTQMPMLDASKGPLIQLCLAEKEKTSCYEAVLVLHHIITDHEGIELFLHEILQVLKGEEASMAQAVPYRNVIAHVAQQSFEISKEYFQSRLATITEPTYPFGLQPAQQSRAELNEDVVKLKRETSLSIRRWCSQHGYTPAVFFHSVWALLLAKCSNQPEVTFGTVLSGRQQSDRNFDKVMGLLINTLPVTVRLSDLSSCDLIKWFSSELIELTQHEQFPLAEALACSSLEPGTGLFSTLLNYRHSQSAAKEIGDDLYASIEGVELLESHDYTNYPFVAAVDDWKTDFSLTIILNNKLSIDTIASYVCTAIESLLHILINEPNTPCQAVKVMPDSEVQHLVYELNDTTMDYPKDKCIHVWFERQAEEKPDNVALVFENKKITYQELNKRANQLAHYLRAHHSVKPDTLIGLCVERSLEMVIGILGILKAGGAYVPLDPSYPGERLKYMLEDADLSLVLSQSQQQGVLDDYKGIIVNIEDLSDVDSAIHSFAQYANTDIRIDEIGLTSSHLAYVIYTSGSTGKPKGVLQTHHNVNRLFFATNKEFSFNDQDCWCLFHSMSFDFSVWELWGALFYGGKLLILTKNEIANTFHLIELFQNHKLTVLNQTPGSFKNLVDVMHDAADTIDSLRYVIFGGEALATHHLAKWFENTKLSSQAQLINMYGITETTVHVTASVIDESNFRHINIGSPLQDQAIYLLDKSLHLVPFGSVGEAYIGGNGLARGYLNREELTVERFVANPFYDELIVNSSKKLYRTGDLLRYLPNGNLKYIGRADEQVKIRGFRIELGEVESQLSQLDEIDSSLVLVKELAGSQQLVAYVKVNKGIAKRNYSEYLKECKGVLSQRLPEYMIPSAFVAVDTWPLTENGKIDKSSLPEPDAHMLQGEYIAPVSETEQKLVEIWADLLDMNEDKISTAANFLELGGNSLLTVRMLMRIKSAFDYSLSIEQLFEQPSISAIAGSIDCLAILQECTQAENNEEAISEGVL